MTIIMVDGARMNITTTGWQARTLVCRSRNGIYESQSSKLCFRCRDNKPFLNLKTSSSSFGHVLLRSRSSSIVCLSNSNSNSEGSPWKAFEKALGNVTRGQSIEQMLKQQMEKRQFYSDTDGAGGGGGDGGAGGGGDYGGDAGGSGGADDDSFLGILDETIQVLLATAAFIFLYIYIITGEELLKLAKDYLVYIFRGTETLRLRRVMNKWRRFWRSWKAKRVEEPPLWLEDAIMNTTTCYDSPEKYDGFLGFVADPRKLPWEETESQSDSEDKNQGFPAFPGGSGEYQE